jgi:DNA-binding transcriptional MerR regulator
VITSQELRPLMTVGDVSEVLQVPCGTVRYWSDQGILKPYHMGRGDQIFDIEDVNRFSIELRSSNGDGSKVIH